MTDFLFTLPLKEATLTLSVVKQTALQPLKRHAHLHRHTALKRVLSEYTDSPLYQFRASFRRIPQTPPKALLTIPHQMQPLLSFLLLNQAVYQLNSTKAHR